MKSPTVDATKIAREQIDQLCFVIVDEPRREMMMISCLGCYELLQHHTNVAFQVVDDFSCFKSNHQRGWGSKLVILWPSLMWQHWEAQLQPGNLCFGDIRLLGKQMTVPSDMKKTTIAS
jgi:hypothetical protein